MKLACTIAFCCILFFTPSLLLASESSGTIHPSHKNALVCHSVDCTTPTPGILNFAPTGTTPVTIDDVNGIDGIAWGNQIGWINFDPTGPEGVTINPSTGVLSGKAWSQVSGWINFSVTGQSVVINNAGEFFGYAWTGGPYGGWIKFDCAFAGACVKTDWRPLSARTTLSGPTSVASSAASPGSSAAPVFDACLNVPGVQDRIPSNYSSDEGGLCLLKVDYCKNIEGYQLSVPLRYLVDGFGECVALTQENRSKFFPDPVIVEGKKKYEYDYCTNLAGLQSQVPTGFSTEGLSCFPEAFDYCPNIYGDQRELPEKMRVTDEGYCEYMTKKELAQYNISMSENKMLKFVFIPTALEIPVVFPIIRKSFVINNKPVDLFSFCISMLIIAGSVAMLSRRMMMIRLIIKKIIALFQNKS